MGQVFNLRWAVDPSWRTGSRDKRDEMATRPRSRPPSPSVAPRGWHGWGAKRQWDWLRLHPWRQAGKERKQRDWLRTSHPFDSLLALLAGALEGRAGR